MFCALPELPTAKQIWAQLAPIVALFLKNMSFQSDLSWHIWLSLDGGERRSQSESCSLWDSSTASTTLLHCTCHARHPQPQWDPHCFHSSRAGNAVPRKVQYSGHQTTCPRCPWQHQTTEERGSSCRPCQLRAQGSDSDPDTRLSLQMSEAQFGLS